MLNPMSLNLFDHPPVLVENWSSSLIHAFGRRAAGDWLGVSWFGGDRRWAGCRGGAGFRRQWEFVYLVLGYEGEKQIGGMLWLDGMVRCKCGNTVWGLVFPWWICCRRPAAWDANRTW